MGEHIEKEHSQNWGKIHQLSASLSKMRFEQIHRCFTLRDRSIYPIKEGESFAWRVEPIATIVRQNCSTNRIPSSHLAIDEAMVLYTGRIDRVSVKYQIFEEFLLILVLLAV